MKAVVRDPAMLLRRDPYLDVFSLKRLSTKWHGLTSQFEAVRRSGEQADSDLSVAGELTIHELRQIAL